LWVNPYAMRVKLALAAKGVSYTCIPQELGPNNKSPLLLQSNPVHKKVPVLLHNHKPVCESLIICEYVDEAFPAASAVVVGNKKVHDLLPKDPYLRATARFWADFGDKKVFDTLLKVVRVPREEFRAVIEEAKGYLQTLEDGAFHAAANASPFFGGAHVGFVDVVLGPLVVLLPAMDSLLRVDDDEDVDVLEVRKLPRLHAWLKAFGDLPFAATILPTPTKLAEAFKGLRKRRFPNEN